MEPSIDLDFTIKVSPVIVTFETIIVEHSWGGRNTKNNQLAVSEYEYIVKVKLKRYQANPLTITIKFYPAHYSLIRTNLKTILIFF
jgi:hypothetical protein